MISSIRPANTVSAVCQPKWSIHRYAERREQELPERSGGGSGAERYAALLERQQFAEGGQHQIERAARQSEADQDAGADIKR
jgi:hypothetical protein